MASIQGYLDCTLGTLPSCTGTGIFGVGAVGCWGIYNDSGVITSSNVDDPIVQGYSTEWMVHRSFRIGASYVCSASGAVPQGTGYSDAYSFRRFSLATRRYTRTVDASDDTLLLVVGNSANSTVSFGYSYYFRILLVE